MEPKPQKSLDEVCKELGEEIKSWVISAIGIPNMAVPQSPKEKKANAEFMELGRWLNVIKHPSVVPIIGSRGSGKSALGYKLLEYLRWTAKPYVVGIPQKSRRLLPDWIGSVPLLEDVPPDSAVLFDEAYTSLHSRASASQYARDISNLINMSRQRGQTLIFIAQEARQNDINIASSANAIIIKNPEILQLEFERVQFRRILAEAQKMFAAIGKDKNRWAYVYAPESNFTGMIFNSLPSFWTPGLSKAYAEARPTDEVRVAKKRTREEKVKVAGEMRRQGFSLGEIAKMLGVSKSTVKNYLDDYPYRRK